MCVRKTMKHCERGGGWGTHLSRPNKSSLLLATVIVVAAAPAIGSRAHAGLLGYTLRAAHAHIGGALAFPTAAPHAALLGRSLGSAALVSAQLLFGLDLLRLLLRESPQVELL